MTLTNTCSLSLCLCLFPCECVRVHMSVVFSLSLIHKTYVKRNSHCISSWKFSELIHSRKMKLYIIIKIYMFRDGNHKRSFIFRKRTHLYIDGISLAIQCHSHRFQLNSSNVFKTHDQQINNKAKTTENHSIKFNFKNVFASMKQIHSLPYPKSNQFLRILTAF